MKSYDCKQCKVAADRSIFLTGLFKKLGLGGKERTAAATVVSKRLASARFPTPGSTWDHRVTFALSDGAEIELIASEDIFQSITPGQSGILTWKGDNFLVFERKEQL
jgi:hypothetical protein